MRQRVGLARALVVHPKVLLMDEPFSALDVLTAETLRTDLLDLWSEGRMPISSILLVTHNIEEAVLMCDRILVFSSNPGRVVAEIKVDLPQPRNRLDPAFRQLVDDIYARMTARPAGKAAHGVFPGHRHLDGVAARVAQPAGRPDGGGGGRALQRPRRPAGRWPARCRWRSTISSRSPRRCSSCASPKWPKATSGSPRPAGASSQLDPDDRKRLFAQHVLAYVPLAAAHQARARRTRHARAPASRFRDELEDHMSEQFAEQTLRAVTSWARYGEIFAYDEASGVFSLDNPS